jgi:membrane fusion protein (multidrug efflux system)
MSTSTIEKDPALSEKKVEPFKAAPPPNSDAPATPTEVPAKAAPGFISRNRRPLLVVAGIIGAVIAGYYIYDSSIHEETDDAYVTGHLHAVAPRINGVVTEVLVDDNQYVHQGNPLVKLDAAEYDAVSAAAKANLGTAEADLDRQQPMLAVHALAPQDVDKTRNTRDVDFAQFELAQLQIQYCNITAPASGYVGRKNVEVGNRVSSGQTLLVVVEPDVWIIANFKETQLAHMKIGQPVRISIDSIPDKTFDGTVDSFSPATGNEFALLPADNSTGNFTKIVQRVPVKILLKPDSIRGYEKRIRAGESAVVKVSTTAPGTEAATQAAAK